MICSDKHQYVYIGIPRAASKSMNGWLCEYHDGHWCGRSLRNSVGTQTFYIPYVNLVLFYERMPECLGELPFADADSIPPFSSFPRKGHSSAW